LILIGLDLLLFERNQSSQQMQDLRQQQQQNLLRQVPIDLSKKNSVN